MSSEEGEFEDPAPAPSRNAMRRALLYLPANDMRKVEKAAKLDVDCICLDLEDAVALNRKEEAREMVIKVLETVDFGDSDVAVRINPLQTQLAEDDITAIFARSSVQPSTIVVPKVDSADDLEWLFDHVYTTVETAREDADVVDLLTQVESPIGLLNLRSICEMDSDTVTESLSLRMNGLIFGSDDYCAAVGATRTAVGTELLYARQAVVTHAKAFGLQAIDLVNINFNDYGELKAECDDGARMGFTGKQIIHPNQIETTQTAFSPSDERIAFALALEEAFMDHQDSGKGAFTFNDQMIDMPTMLQCQSVLAMARKIGKVPPKDE